MRDRQLNVTQQNASFVENIDERNAALSAIQVTVGKLKKNTNWRNDYEPYRVSVPGSTVEVEMDDPTSDSSIPANEIRLTADVSAGDSEIEVIAMVSGSGLPAMDGALTLISDHIDFSASGNAFSIDGHDHNLWGSREWSSSTVKPGVTVNSESAESSLEDGLRHMQTDNIDGSGGEPSIEVDRDFDVEGLNTKADSWASQADITIDGGRQTNAVWGTRDNPKVTVVNDDVQLNGNAGGFGVLIVENGSKLQANGNFHFQGIILMRGDSPELDIRGNGKILGMTTMLGCSSSGSSGQTRRDDQHGDDNEDEDSGGPSWDDDNDDDRGGRRWWEDRGSLYKISDDRSIHMASAFGAGFMSNISTAVADLFTGDVEKSSEVNNTTLLQGQGRGKGKDKDKGKGKGRGNGRGNNNDDDEDDSESAGGSSGDCELKIDLRGNVDIKYSSKALGIIKDKMGSKMGIDFEILRIYE